MHTAIYFPFLPPTLNEIIRECKANRHAYARLKDQFTQDCAVYAMGAPTFSGKVWLAFHWHVSTLKRDPADNTQAAAKFVLDGLVAIGVLSEDNGYVIQPPIVTSWQKKKPEGLVLRISDQPIFQLVELQEVTNALR
jgi:hypothetical protein